jgi:hypothetical protein
MKLLEYLNLRLLIAQLYLMNWIYSYLWTYLQSKVKTLKSAHFRSCTLLSFIVYFVVY